MVCNIAEADQGVSQLPGLPLRNRITKLVKEGKLAALGDGSYRVAG